MSAKKFIRKNIIAIVMVPAIFGSHYGWYKLQMNDALVSPAERENLPIISVMGDIFSLSAIKAAFGDKKEK